MFVSHISCFMGYNHKTQLWRCLNELIDAGLIDKIKYHKHCIIKVKSFAIKRILGQDKVDSIFISGYRIQKSAMICSIIQKSYQVNCLNPDDYLSMVKKFSNFFYPSNADLFVLEEIKKNFNLLGMNTVCLEKEIARISETELSKRNTLQNVRNKNIYIEKYGCKEQIFYIALAVLDMTMEFSPSNIAKRLENVIGYYDSIFCNNLRVNGNKYVHYIFTFYVIDEYRDKYLRNQIKKAKEILMDKRIELSTISLRLINLDITSTLFSNQKIITF